eukprot:752854-Hanusia_phi.AAC.1
MKRGYDEEQQEAIATSAMEKKSWGRSGLGFSSSSHQPSSSSSSAPSESRKGGYGKNVQLSAAAHYNNREDTHRRLDSDSDTLQQKNFNNWVKAMLISSAVRPMYSILDLACGKGGDLPKWAKQEIGHYVGVDIAYKSITDAIQRYNGQQNRAGCNFPAIWCAGNFCKSNFFNELEKVEKGVRFDAVSCQVFSSHLSSPLVTSRLLCFPSLSTSFRLFVPRLALARSSVVEEPSPSSNVLISRATVCDSLLVDIRTGCENSAAECCEHRRLKPGGLFVGTTTDANVLVKKLQEAPGLKFGNSLYSVEFLPKKGESPANFDKTFHNHSPYGIRYRFYLKDAVDDCEEACIAACRLPEAGLELVEHINLHDFFERATTKSSKKAVRCQVCCATQSRKISGRNANVSLALLRCTHLLAGHLPVQDLRLQKDPIGVVAFCSSSSQLLCCPRRKLKAATTGDRTTKVIARLPRSWRPREVLVQEIIILTPDCHPQSQGIS